MFNLKKQLQDYRNELLNKKELGETTGLIGIDTGIKELNDITRGIKKQEYILLGARPSMGKTSFSTQILINSIKNGHDKILFLSLEMSKEVILARVIAQYLRIPLSTSLYGENFDIYIEAIDKAIEELEDSNLYIEDFSEERSTIENIEKIVENYEKEKEGVDLIILDYIQLISSEKIKTTNSNNKVDEISKILVKLKKHYNCPLIALSQLSRDLEKRNDKRPILSDLRDSGALEQDADLILFLYKHDVYLEKILKAKFSETQDTFIEVQLNQLKEKESNEVEVIVAKNRNGPLGTVQIDFIKESTSFIDYENIEENEEENSIDTDNDNEVDVDKLFNNIYAEQ